MKTKQPKIKINPKYKSLFKNDKRYHIISGGRGSGKSYSVALYLLLLTLEEGNVILFSRYTMTSVQISVYPEFIDKIETLGLHSMFEITRDEIINKVTKSRIIFKGIKTGSSLQTANLKSISNLNIVVIDEAEEIPDEATFDKIDLSVRRMDKTNKVILVFNPTTKANWLYQRFFEQEGIEPGLCQVSQDTNYIHTSYLDNIKNLDESFLKRVEKIRLTNPTKYLHIILGAFLDVAEGVIFANWSIGEFNNNLPFGVGIDFGWSPDPTAAVKIAIDKDQMIIYMDEIVYKTEQDTNQIATVLIDRVGKSTEVIGDYANSGRLIEEIKRKGVNIKPCTKGAGSVAEGITLMQDYKLVVTSTSINLIKELNNYIWSDKKSGSPVDLYNHLLDAARYRISHSLKNPMVTQYKIR